MSAKSGGRGGGRRGRHHALEGFSARPPRLRNAARLHTPRGGRRREREGRAAAGEGRTAVDPNDAISRARPPPRGLPLAAPRGNTEAAQATHHGCWERRGDGGKAGRGSSGVLFFGRPLLLSPPPSPPCRHAPNQLGPSHARHRPPSQRALRAPPNLPPRPRAPLDVCRGCRPSARAAGQHVPRARDGQGAVQRGLSAGEEGQGERERRVTGGNVESAGATAAGPRPPPSLAARWRPLPG